MSSDRPLLSKSIHVWLASMAACASGEWPSERLRSIGFGPLALISPIERPDPESPNRARLAWNRRAALLSPAGRPESAKLFLAFSREHARQIYTVHQAAADMATSLRSLSRWSIGWFELPPGTIIDLARICSVAEEIGTSDRPLKAIAAGHSFDSPSSMGRLFLRYSGTTPALYRLGSRLERLAESAQTDRKNRG